MALQGESAKGIYLSVANGSIWNKKASQDDPNYAVEEFDRPDGTKGERSGARYKTLEGTVVGVKNVSHDKYGDSICVTFESGEDRYIVSISANNRFSQDMMKFLLVADLSIKTLMRPYTFTGDDGKQVRGIAFKQNGEKVNIRYENDDMPTKGKEWFKGRKAKEIKRFFEDLTDWFIAEIEETIVPQFSDEKPKAKAKAEPKEEEKEEVVKKATPLQMRKFVKAYAEENYPEETVPVLKGETLTEWYELAKAGEELPFSNEKVSDDDLDAQLNSLDV